MPRGGLGWAPPRTQERSQASAVKRSNLCGVETVASAGVRVENRGVGVRSAIATAARELAVPRNLVTVVIGVVIALLAAPSGDVDAYVILIAPLAVMAGVFAAIVVAEEFVLHSNWERSPTTPPAIVHRIFVTLFIFLLTQFAGCEAARRVHAQDIEIARQWSDHLVVRLELWKEQHGSYPEVLGELVHVTERPRLCQRHSYYEKRGDGFELDFIKESWYGWTYRSATRQWVFG